MFMLFALLEGFRHVEVTERRTAVDYARIPDAETLKREVAARQRRRNTLNAKANWRFTTANARIKLKSMYRAL